METGALGGGVMLLAGATVLIGIGALVGWWLRERYEYSNRSYRSDMRPQSDDLSGAMHLLEELLRLHRGTTAQLHDVQSRIEFLSHQVAESQRTLRIQMVEALQSAHVDRARPDELSSFSTAERRVHHVTPAAAPDWSGFTDRRLNRAVMGETPNMTVRQEAATEDATSYLESAAAAFLSSADSREFDNAAVATFFAERGVTASFVLESDNRWAMIAVQRGSNDRLAVGIPAIRVGMRQIDLQPYFDFVSYNGVDPIRSSQVVRLASLTRDSGKWVTTQKGIIDGSR